jgi:hypothetical protein
MRGMPAHCSRCGLIFESPVFAITGNIRNVTFRNNKISCPRLGCGEIADGIDGTFDYVDNAIRVIRAPPKTIAIVSVLQRALREAEQGRPEAEVINKIEATSAELADAIRKKVSTSKKPILVTLLLSLLASCSVSSTLNWNQLVDQVHVYQTGADPYSGLDQATASMSDSDDKPKASRQQRRYNERQAKKQQRQIERRQLKKPAR